MKSIIAAAVGVLAIGGVAQAKLVKFTMEAEFVEVAGTIPTNTELAELIGLPSFAAEFTYDTMTPISASPTPGLTEHADAGSFSFLGGINANQSQALGVALVQDDPNGFDFESITPNAFFGPSAGVITDQMLIRFRDTTPDDSFINSTTFPETIDIGLLEIAVVVILHNDLNGQLVGQSIYNITSLTSSPVPVPGALVFFTTAAAGFLARRAKTIVLA